MKLASAVVLTILVLAPPARADVDRLDQAERALRDLRYEKADELLEGAQRAGDNGPRELARLYRLRGQLAGSLGDEAGAADAFAAWLSLEPDAELPAGTSPKIVGPFQAAAARLEGASLRVDFHLAGDGSAVALEVVEDPLAMVTGARAAYRGRVDEARATGGEARVELVGAHRGRLLVSVAALDVYGNRLSEHELTVEPDPPPAAKPKLAKEPAKPKPKPSPAPASPPAPRTRDEGPGFHQGWVWGGAAVGLGLVGGYFGWRALSGQRELDGLNAASDQHTYLEARDTAARLERDSGIANASFVLAGACAVATLLLWPEERPARRLRGAVGRDQASLAVEWSW